MTERSLLDDHLAEIDRRLREIQSGLEPALEPRPGPEGVVYALDRRRPAPPARDAEPVSGSAPALAMVSAGPLREMDALAGFERALAQLPGVRQVRLREYEGADRAVFEVLLDEQIS